MTDNPPVHLRTPEEMSPEERAKLEQLLDSGITELPDNQVKGFLGEKAPDMRQVEEFEPDLNAGILQENDMGVIWLVIILMYLLVFTIPVAYALLWLSKGIPRKTKLIASAVGAAGIALVALRFLWR